MCLIKEIPTSTMKVGMNGYYFEYNGRYNMQSHLSQIYVEMKWSKNDWKFEDWKCHLEFRYMVEDGSHKSEHIEHGGKVVIE
jgi:hypothetical protein